MIALKCKMCGGDLSVSPGASVGTCQYCGTTMTLPVTGSTQVADQFNRASGLRQGDEFDRASEVYLRLLEANPRDAEAHWGMVLCRFGITYVEDPKTGRRPPATGSASAPSWRTRTISRPSPGPTVRPRRSIRRRPRPLPPSSGSSWTSPPERSPLMSFCATRRRMGRGSGRRTACWPRSSTTSSPKRATGSFSPASPWRASWASPTSPIFSPPSGAPGSWWW